MTAPLAAHVLMPERTAVRANVLHGIGIFENGVRCRRVFSPPHVRAVRVSETKIYRKTKPDERQAFRPVFCLQNHTLCSSAFAS